MPFCTVLKTIAFFSIITSTSFAAPAGADSARFINGADSSANGLHRSDCLPAPGCVTQTIDLKQGWNLISINIVPADKTIARLFDGLQVLEIKNMDYFWSNAQPAFLCKLQTFIPGCGYLVNMQTSGKLTVTGTPLSAGSAPATTRTGWVLIGCPYQSPMPMAAVFGCNFLVIKDFNGFRTPAATQNSLDNIEPGNAYFLRR